MTPEVRRCHRQARRVHRHRRGGYLGTRGTKEAGLLPDAGHDPELILSYGLAPLPSIFNGSSGRRRVQELTGNRWVPTLLLDDGTVIDGSHKIMDWAHANPA